MKSVRLTEAFSQPSRLSTRLPIQPAVPVGRIHEQILYQDRLLAPWSNYLRLLDQKHYRLPVDQFRNERNVAA
jgi:hypothetical protein